MSRRPHEPSGDTPHPSPKKPYWIGPRSSTWRNDESAALVEYVALHHAILEGNDWPTTHDKNFWTECAKFVANKTERSARSRKFSVYRIFVLLYYNTVKVSILR